MALASDHTHWALNLLETFEISRTLQSYIYVLSRCVTKINVEILSIVKKNSGKNSDSLSLKK